MFRIFVTKPYLRQIDDPSLKSGRQESRVGDVQVRLEAINRVYEFMILGVLKLGCISRYTPWTNAIPMYNVKLVDVFSGLLRSRPIKFQYFSGDY